MNLLNILVILSLLVVLKCNAQVYVTQSVSMLFDQIFFSFLNDGKTTKITFTTQNDDSLRPPNGIWIAIGFNDRPIMFQTNAAILRFASDNSLTWIRNYYNPSTTFPLLVSPSDPSLGFSNFSMKVDANITVSFDRLNQLPGVPNYYQLTSNSKPYVVFAFGLGDLAYHGSNKDISKNTLNFESMVTETTTTTTTTTIASTSNVQNFTSSATINNSSASISPIQFNNTNPSLPSTNSTNSVSTTTSQPNNQINFNNLIQQVLQMLFNFLSGLFR